MSAVDIHRCGILGWNDIVDIISSFLARRSIGRLRRSVVVVRVVVYPFLAPFAALDLTLARRPIGSQAPRVVRY
jgi:hypothetical protein